MSKIGDTEMDFIVDLIAKERCVPFLGSGVNLKKNGYEGLPLGYAVAEVLAEKLKSEKLNLPMPCKTCIVAEELAEKLKSEKGANLNLARLALELEVRTQRQNLIRILNEILPDCKREPSRILRIISELPFKTIVTTNYDRLLERALTDKGRIFERIVQDKEGFDNSPETKELFNKLQLSKDLVIYKIHGSFPLDAHSPREELSPIITEDDYIEFLTVINQADTGVPKFLQKRLDPNTFLFLGYSLEDWDFRTIYKTLIKKGEQHLRGKSFAIQKNPPQFWVDFWLTNGVKIFDIDLYDFAEQLMTAWEKKGFKDDTKKPNDTTI